MRAKNAFPLLYIYSYGKISLELCVFRTHPSHKMQQHGFYSKKSLWQSHFLSFFLSLLFYFEFFYLLTENAEGCYISSHSMTHTHSIWLLWTRDRLVAATLPDDRHTKEADIHAPAGIQAWNHSKRPADTHALDGATTGVRSRATWRANNHHTNFRGD